MTTRQRTPRTRRARNPRSWNGAACGTLAILTLSAFGSSTVARAQVVDPNAAGGAPPAPTGNVPPAPLPPPPPPGPLPPLGEAMPPPPPPEPPRRVPQDKRKKDLETTVGMDPVQHDIGPEADVLGAVDLGVPRLKTKGWKYAMHGYFRAPVRVGYGPRNDLTNGNQLHSPARVPGYNNTEWEYVGLTPNPGGSLYLNISSPQVSGNIILTTDTLNDATYDNLVKIGGIAQAYITLKFPETFGSHGGLAWTVGAFSNRYGNAGPRQESTGYYGTYLFGRTHVAGEALTANFDLNEHVELVLEHGFGAKLEVVPYVLLSHAPPPPIAPYLPYQGPVPQGSTFVHHAHASLLVDDWLMVGAHYLYSYSPNDYAYTDGFFAMGETRAKSASMTVLGGEVHVDGPKMGSGYIGYSHVNADSILPLGSGLEVLHGFDGFGFKQNYFGKLTNLASLEPNPLTNPNPGPHNDSGKVDTVLFQYILRLAPLIGRGRTGPDVALGLFGMYNHVQAPNNVTQDRLKFGADVTVTPFRFVAASLRFDRVLPDGPTTAFAYSALSPRLIFHTNWLSREYIIVDYTRYFYGPMTVASPPYDVQIKRPDPNMVVVSAAISF
jgi:hypothetical protein